MTDQVSEIHALLEADLHFEDEWGNGSYGNAVFTAAQYLLQLVEAAQRVIQEANDRQQLRFIGRDIRGRESVQHGTIDHAVGSPCQLCDAIAAYNAAQKEPA